MLDDPRAKPVPASWREPIDGWSRALAAAGWTRETIRTRTDHLRRASRALWLRNPWEVTADELLDWCGGQDWQRETRRSVYASLRSFYRWGLATGRTVGPVPTEILPGIPPQPPSPRPLPEPYLVIALDQADDRVVIILRIGAELGLRRSEVAQVSLTDLWRDGGGWMLTVHGKGGRRRDVPVLEELAAEIIARCRRDGHRGWLLPGNDHGHLSAQYVGKLASRVLPAGWGMHTLRHRCATVVHDATGDLLVVQRILGHASVATTQRYVKVRDEAIRKGIAHAATRPGRAAVRVVAA